eukprot:scaffold67230_cov61-Phaeocystis_antarctica.AAC.4
MECRSRAVRVKCTAYHGTPGGAKHAADALVAAGTLLAAALLSKLRRRLPSWLQRGHQRGSWRAPQPTVGVPALPCALVASYYNPRPDPNPNPSPNPSPATNH